MVYARLKIKRGEFVLNYINDPTWIWSMITYSGYTTIINIVNYYIFLRESIDGNS